VVLRKHSSKTTSSISMLQYQYAAQVQGTVYVCHSSYCVYSHCCCTLWFFHCAVTTTRTLSGLRRRAASDASICSSQIRAFLCVCSYSNPHPVAEDYAKEPPVMPPHLQIMFIQTQHFHPFCSFCLQLQQPAPRGRRLRERAASDAATPADHVISTQHFHPSCFCCSQLQQPAPCG
jgi:hypothetical protein